MSRFWPASEAAQADYERLRDAALANGRLPDDLASARFRRRGIAGLIAWPVSEPVFVAMLLGATRPPWTPYEDPRTQGGGGRLPATAGAGRPRAGRSSRSLRDGLGGELSVPGPGGYVTPTPITAGPDPRPSSRVFDDAAPAEPFGGPATTREENRS